MRNDDTNDPIPQRMLRKEYSAHVRRYLWGGHFWSGSYFAGSCGGHR